MHLGPSFAIFPLIQCRIFIENPFDLACNRKVSLMSLFAATHIPSHTDQTAFEAAIRGVETVFLTAHVNPDGDTLGSMLALKHAFDTYCPQMKRVDCAITGKMPDVFHFLPAIEKVYRLEEAQGLPESYDLAISVDCGSISRLGLGQAYFNQAKSSLNIDHHVSNEAFADTNVVLTEASASGQVIAYLLDGAKMAITPEIATCIYATILTDTGGFKYSNTTQAVFELAARLVQAGANPELIYKHMYEIRPKCQVDLVADAMLRIQLSDDSQIGWTTVSQKDFKTFGAEEEHTEGIVEGIRQIDTVKLAAFFREMSNGHTKVSTRSDDHRLNVSNVMGLFGGGGHKMAAGCTIEAPIHEAVEKVTQALRDILQAL